MTKKRPAHCLMISLLGRDQPGIIKLICKIIKACQCTITSSKLNTTGECFAFILQVHGQWHALAKLETQLPRIARQNDYALNIKRSQVPELKSSLIPYYIEMIASHQPDIILNITKYFSEQSINIDEMNIETYIAQRTSTEMLKAQFSIFLPVKTNLAQFRESFLLYTEQHNLDVVMEPVK